MNLRETFSPVSPRYLFGTDEMGRCILSRVLHGAHLTLGAALIAVFIGMGLGVPIGLVAGYFGGMIDSAFMAGADMLLSFPYFLLAVLIVAVMGPSLQSNMIAIGIWVSPYYIRLVRGATLALRQREFVEAARMSGENDLNILLRYILPNCISVVIVWSTTYYARAILMAAALGFLGLGAQPPTPEWGAMTANARMYIFRSISSIIFPAVFILMSALSFNLIGDSLRDVLDPKLRGGKAHG
jgi:ABC-type dipeptide/oligopeptide/nickel transport system permease subunit